MKDCVDVYEKFTSKELSDMICLLGVCKSYCYRKDYDYSKGEHLPDFFHKFEAIQDDMYMCISDRRKKGKSA
jgi:hypothetical protein